MAFAAALIAPHHQYLSLRRTSFPRAPVLFLSHLHLRQDSRKSTNCSDQTTHNRTEHLSEWHWDAVRARSWSQWSTDPTIHVITTAWTDCSDSAVTESILSLFIDDVCCGQQMKTLFILSKVRSLTMLEVNMHIMVGRVDSGTMEHG